MHRGLQRVSLFETKLRTKLINAKPLCDNRHLKIRRRQQPYQCVHQIDLRQTHEAIEDIGIQKNDSDIIFTQKMELCPPAKRKKKRKKGGCG